MRILTQDHRALQTGVVHLDDAVLAVQLLVDLQQQVQNLGVGIRIPAAVRAGRFHLHACHVEAALQRVHDHHLHVLAARAGQHLQRCLATLDVDDGQVARCLHHVGVARNHAQHTVVAAVDGIHEVVLNLHGHLHLRCLHVFHDHLDAAFNVLILVGEGLQIVLCQLLQGGHVLLRQRQHHLSLEGDGVPHVAAMPCGQTDVALLDGIAHNLHHHLVGIAATLVNLQTAMTTAQTLQRHAHGSILSVRLHLFIFKRTGHVDTAGRANHELTPRLGVQVQQDVALQHLLGQVVRTVHARLLVGGDQRLHRSVLQVLGLHHSQDGCHAQSVVGTQRGALCLHPLTVYPRLYGVGLEVMRRLRRLLRHHVHVGLQDHTLAVFHARCGRLAHHHVATLVDEGLHAGFLGEVEQELLYFLQMSARARHLCECIEVLPDALRFQVANFVHFI